MNCILIKPLDTYLISLAFAWMEFYAVRFNPISLILNIYFEILSKQWEYSC